MGTVFGLTDEVRSKFRNAKAMIEQARFRMPKDPKAALDYANSCARKRAEALELARLRGEETETGR